MPNDDDPSISTIDIFYKYKMAVEKVGLSVKQARQVQKNALQVCFLSDAE
ncbi:MAG: hypothetical protein GYA18_10450 [Chloroflexi bacterium]|nr:hypothetical protein [Chloroflexota bacterium]